MCGIFGYIGEKPARPILMEGLRKLEYRGYDSAGIVIKNGALQIHKKKGKVSKLESILPNALKGEVGIAHTRWATHGEANDTNAHPHSSADGSIAIVHNGIIENAKRLRKHLEKAGYNFLSETDSEVLVHLIDREYKKGAKPITAVKRALKRANGTWGLCVIFREEEEIIVARNGSPIVLGKDNNQMFISSDPHALSKHTDRVIFLEDGEIASVDKNGFEITTLDGKTSTTTITILEDEWGDAELGDYPHFMLKEIHEQPEALRQCISGRCQPGKSNIRLGGIGLSPSQLRSIPHVRLIGCGTSLHACEVGQLAIEALARLPAVSHVASEFRYTNPVINPKAIHLAVSQSGETADTLSAVKEIQLQGANAWGIVNVVASSIARQCGQGVYIHSGPEQSVASTKAFTNMVAALSMFAIQIARSRSLSSEIGEMLIQELLEVPKKIETYLASQGPIHSAVELIDKAKSVLFLGRGFSAPVAKEGALKLMEIAYIPCLAYPAGEMKHGPIALLEEGSPVIMIAPNDKHKKKNLSSLHECRARGAKIILIHEQGDSIASEGDVSIPIPKSHEIFSPLISVVPLQLIAYHTALKLGKNVDRPRNLAKSVTVE